MEETLMASCIKTISRGYIFCGLLGLGLGLGPIAAAPAHAEDFQKIAAYKGADREQMLADGAKKEGSLTLYMNIPQAYSNLFVQPFEKKYGIKVNIWRARSELTLKRTIDEARAGKSSVDVIDSISPPMEALRREKLLEKIDSPIHKELQPYAIPKHHEWVSMREIVFVQAYNTNKIKKEDLPKTYQDLLGPKWKGNVGIESGDQEWVSSVINDMGKEKGLKYFRDLANNGLTLVTGHPVLINSVISGEVSLGLTVYNYDAFHWKEQKAPVDWFAIEPAVTISDGIAVAKNAPHPHAALLFYEYMLGPEAQGILAKLGFVPTNVKVESPLKNVKLKVLDASALLDEDEASEKQFKTLLVDKH
jgi:iron(III) transport system substrate-binding protein